MRQYNRYKRATNKLKTRKITQMHDKCDGRNRQIHIHIRYANYNRIEYVKVIHGKTRNNKAQTYVNMTNAMNEIFPEINAPHNKHTHRATAPYHKYIPTRTNYTAPEGMMDKYIYKYTDTRRVKCIIYNTKNEMIHYGIFRRTKEINGRHITITLHSSDRSIQVKPYIPMTNKIHGIELKEIYRHGVEIYRI